MSMRPRVTLALLLGLSIGLGWSILRFGPQSAYAHHSRGLAWSEKKDDDKAITDYNEAIRLDPLSARAYYDRAIALSQLPIMSPAN
jgi:tetratricopeptide (TPR) repeat protein